MPIFTTRTIELVRDDLLRWLATTGEAMSGVLRSQDDRSDAIQDAISTALDARSAALVLAVSEHRSAENDNRRRPFEVDDELAQFAASALREELEAYVPLAADDDDPDDSLPAGYRGAPADGTDESETRTC